MNLETLIGATGDEWERAAVAATLDDYLESVQTYMDREYAGFVEPIVFAFRDGADWPLLGWVRCRAAWPGVDTAKAVVNMGHAAVGGSNRDERRKRRYRSGRCLMDTSGLRFVSVHSAAWSCGPSGATTPTSGVDGTTGFDFSGVR